MVARLGGGPGGCASAVTSLHRRKGLADATPTVSTLGGPLLVVAVASVREAEDQVAVLIHPEGLGVNGLSTALVYVIMLVDPQPLQGGTGAKAASE